MDKIKVALIQMDSGKDKQENLRQAKKYLEQAAKEGANVVCFPEMMNGEAENRHMQNISESVFDAFLLIFNMAGFPFFVFVTT